MDTANATYPPAINREGSSGWREQSTRNLFRLFSDPLSPRADSLKAARSPESLLLATPANMMLSPQQDPMTPPETDIPALEYEEGTQAGADGEDSATFADGTEKLLRRMPMRGVHRPPIPLVLRVAGLRAARAGTDAGRGGGRRELQVP